MILPVTKPKRWVLVGGTGFAVCAGLILGLRALGRYESDVDRSFEVFGLVSAAAGFLIVLVAGLALWATDRFSAERQADEAYERVRERTTRDDARLVMKRSELRARAAQDSAELGPEASEPRDQPGPSEEPRTS